MSKSSFASLIVTYWQVCHLRVKIKLIQPRLWQPQQQASGQSHHLRFAAGQSVGIHFAFVSLNIIVLTLRRGRSCGQTTVCYKDCFLLVLIFSFCVKVLITNEKTNLIKQENPLLIMALLLVVYTCLFLRLVIKLPTCVHCLEVLRKYQQC